MSARPARLVSGGQSGVDRAALDVALALGLPHGGWCPRGRRAEDGPIPLHYQLVEAGSERYEERTELNVRDSDATLILATGPLSGGTALTLELARALGRPCLVVRLDGDQAEELARTRAWLASGQVRVLNVAGPRESGSPGIGEQARRFLTLLLERAAGR